MKYRDIPLRDITPILPILLFVFILNCFRGGGEIVLRWGPIIILKQGIMRGVYFSAVIMEIFIMSKLLTKGFPPDSLLSTLYTIDTVICKIFRCKNSYSLNENNPFHSRKNFILILFYVLRIFRIIYTELKIFFTIKGKSLKGKIIQFFNTVFKQSLDKYEKMKKVTVSPVKPVIHDYIYISVQVFLFSFLIILKNWQIT